MCAVTTRICKVEDCGEDATAARGYCPKHYQRLRLTGTTDDPVLINKGKTCSIDGCIDPAYAKGLCVNHNRRKKLTGDPHKTIRISYHGVECFLPHCNTQARSKGMCGRHYTNYKQHLKYGNVSSVEDYVKLKETQCNVGWCKEDQVENGICKHHNEDFKKQLKKLRVKDAAEYIRKKGKGEV